MIKEKSVEGSSEGEKASFDFKYKIDISDRKGKTGETFKHESGYDFEDFKDFGDGKSQKSYLTSQRKVLPSELAKPSEESFHLTENPTELSIKRKGGSFMLDEGGKSQPENSIHIETDFAQYGQNSPVFRFENERNLNKTTTNYFMSKMDEEAYPGSPEKLKHQHSMEPPSRAENFQYLSSNVQEQTSNKKYLSYNVSSSRQKIPQIQSARASLENEYKDLCASIQFYENEMQKIEYENLGTSNEIEKYQKLITDWQQNEKELLDLTRETNEINYLISNQRALEKALIATKNTVEEEFDSLVQEIECMHFARPPLMKDETKVIIDEINALKTEFESLKRDEGSLNLSNTLQNTVMAPSIENRFSFLPQNGVIFNPEENLMDNSIKEILQHSKTETNFIYNIKMLLIKDENKMFENKEIIINCCTRDYPMIEVKVGNKTSKNLCDFTIKESNLTIADKEILQAKSYYIHSYKMVIPSQPFLKMEIEYTSGSGDGRNYLERTTLFLPTLPLKHGEFLPITEQEYRNELQRHQHMLDYNCSGDLPIDGRIIRESLSEVRMLFPNLLEIEPNVFAGVFRLWNSNNGALIALTQNNSNTICIEQWGGINYLLQTFKFLFTLLI